MAARTRRVKVGTAVLLPALRNPVLLAHQVATLDQVSAGRVILGVGIASDVANIRAEFRAAGVPFEKRVGTMMEGLRLARALWSGKPVDWDGRWHVEQGVIGPVPHQPGGPPIWVGAGVHRTGARRAARLGDAWVVPPHASPEQLTPVLDLYRSERERLGRGPAREVVVRRELVLDEDPDRAMAVGIVFTGAVTANGALEEFGDIAGTAVAIHFCIQSSTGGFIL